MLKLLVFSTDFPYPPNHGGRVDTWRRLLALKKLGVEVFLVSWFWTLPTDSDLATVRSAVRELAHYKIGKDPLANLLRFFRLTRFPLSVASRVLSKADENALFQRVEDFKPDAVFLDGIWGAVAAELFSRKLCIPFFLRSHNVEHEYMARQLEIEKSKLKKIKLLLSVLHLKRFELSLFKRVDCVFEISCADMGYWESKSVKSIKWLPPVLDVTYLSSSDLFRGEKSFDIVFLGNLSTPNNIEGIKWFIEAVLPLVKKYRPDVSVCIAGSNPSGELRSALVLYKNIFLIENPISASEVFFSGRCLINPALSGSGVNIKSVEMLLYDVPIVVTSQAVKGLPEHILGYFKVASDPTQFAANVISALESSDSINRRNIVDKYFGLNCIVDLVKYIEDYSTDVRR